MRYSWVLLFLTAFLTASDIGWVSDYAAAKARAAAEGKIVYLMITTEGCRWCRKMEETTLADGEIRRRIEELAVPVEVRRDVDRYPRKLKAPMVPMHYFLGTDEKVLVKMPGFWNKEDFMDILDDVERKMK